MDLLSTYPAPRWLALLALTSCLAGCGGPTSLFLQLDMRTGDPTPAQLHVALYDNWGALIRDHAIDAPQLPGSLIIKLSDEDQSLRVAVSSTSYRGSARALVTAHEQARALVVLNTTTLDSDDDGVPDDVDNCPTLANPDQADSTGLGWGDACRGDADLAGVTDLGQGPQPDLTSTGTPDDLSGGPDLPVATDLAMPPNVDMTTSPPDLAPPCPVGALLCEEFEGAAVDTGRWFITSTAGKGSIGLDTSKFKRGASALKIHVNGTSSATGLSDQHLQLKSTLSGSTMFVRFFIFASALPSSYSELMNLSTSSGASGVTMNLDTTKNLLIDSYTGSSGGQLYPQKDTGMQLPTGSWTCLEYEIGSTAKLYVNDTLIGTSNSFTVSSALNILIFGLELPGLNAGAAAYDLWLDSLVVANARVGCAN